MAEKARKTTKKALILILVILCTLILGLIIGIAIIANNPSLENGNIINTTEDANSSSNISEYTAEIDHQISEAKTSEEKVNLYNQKINYVASHSEFGEYADQMIQDTISIDKIEQSVASAGQVINTASAYGKDSIVNEYEQIMQQRMKDQGAE